MDDHLSSIPQAPPIVAPSCVRNVGSSSSPSRMVPGPPNSSSRAPRTPDTPRLGVLLLAALDLVQLLPQHDDLLAMLRTLLSQLRNQLPLVLPSSHPRSPVSTPPAAASGYDIHLSGCHSPCKSIKIDPLCLAVTHGVCLCYVVKKELVIVTSCPLTSST